MPGRRGALLAVLLTAACGTTVPLGQRATATSPEGGLGPGPAPSSSTAPAVPRVAGRPGSGPSVDVPVQDSGAPASPPATGADTPTGTTPAAKAPVQVGIPYAKNSGDALTALGGSSSTGTDQSTMFKAVIADANRHGGIAGHPIQPVFFGIDVTGDQTAQFQSACADFTQDHKVFAALGIGGPAYYTCLQKAGVVVLAPPDGDSREQAQWPLQLAPSDMVLDRAARTYVAALQTSYLTARARIGVLTYTAESFQRITRDVLLPALRRVDPQTLVQSVTRTQSASDLGTMSSAVSNAVLKFRSAGVDHVVFFVDGGLPESFFANDAQSQGYHPRYAFSTLDQLQATIEAGLFSSAAQQLAGAVGVGWQPILDTAYPSPFLSTTSPRRCLAVGKAQGVVPGSGVAAAQLMSACDGVWFLQAAAARASSVSPRAVVTSALSLGTAYSSPVTPRTRFAGNHDGAAGYQFLRFEEGCTCLRGDGPVREASS